jgi:hypothetical protein
VAAAVIGVIALALVLDRQAPYRPPPAKAAPRTAASLTAPEVARIARRVERIRGLRFKQPVRPLFVGRAEAVRMEQEANAKAQPERAQAGDAEALKLLGLLRPHDSLAQAFNAIEGEQVLGFYDDRRKRLVVIRDRGANQAMLEITLAHELTHALEDQVFGLREGGSTDDEALARSALAEGTATVVMAEYAVRYFGIDDALSLLGSASSEKTKLPRYVEDTLLFPYEQGANFVEAFRPDGGSWKALDNVIRFRRPATAAQVLHPDKYAIDKRPVPIRMPDLPRVLGAGWRRAASSSVGEDDLREIFKIVGRKPEPAAAAGWGGGRFDLFEHSRPDGCDVPCVRADVGVMSLAWDTARDRRAGEAALAAAFEHGLQARAVGRRGPVRQWSSRGGTIALRRGALKTVVVFAPDAALAAKVLASFA